MMRRILKGISLAVLLIAVQSRSARAAVTKVEGGFNCVQSVCGPNNAVRVAQHTITTLLVKGQGVDSSKNPVEVTGAGIFAQITNHFSIAPGELFGTGAVNVELVVHDDASPGRQTVTLHGDQRYTFTIMVIHTGKVTGVTFPPPAQDFQEIDLTFQGVHIGDASTGGRIFTLDSDGEFTHEITGTTTLRVLPGGDENHFVLRLHFPSSVTAIQANLIVKDKNCVQNTCPDYEGLTDNMTSDVTIFAPNKVSFITVSPAKLRWGSESPLTITVNLAYPVPTSQSSAVIHTGPAFPQGGPSRPMPLIDLNLSALKWHVELDDGPNPELFQVPPGTDYHAGTNIDNTVQNIPQGARTVTLVLQQKGQPEIGTHDGKVFAILGNNSSFGSAAVPTGSFSVCLFANNAECP